MDRDESDAPSLHRQGLAAGCPESDEINGEQQEQLQPENRARCHSEGKGAENGVRQNQPDQGDGEQQDALVTHAGKAAQQAGCYGAFNTVHQRVAGETRLANARRAAPVPCLFLAVTRLRRHWVGARHQPLVAEAVGVPVWLERPC